jgi:transposase
VVGYGLVVTTSRRPYPSDLSDARWALIEPILTEWRAARAANGLGINAPVRELREIVNAILWVNRTGAGWDYLPHDLPPRSTVYWYYGEWEEDGTTEAIHEMLRGRVRKAAGRAVEPTAALVDAQSVRTSSNVPEASQGIDAGKLIK